MADFDDCLAPNKMSQNGRFWRDCLAPRGTSIP